MIVLQLKGLLVIIIIIWELSCILLYMFNRHFEFSWSMRICFASSNYFKVLLILHDFLQICLQKIEFLSFTNITFITNLNSCHFYPKCCFEIGFVALYLIINILYFIFISTYAYLEDFLMTLRDRSQKHKGSNSPCITMFVTFSLIFLVWANLVNWHSGNLALSNQ